MNLTGQRFFDLLAIGRVSNLPTVWSNMVTGILLAWALQNQEMPFSAGLQPLLLIAGVTSAYLFGTFLNDWKDVDFDTRHRPERAIPSGRWSRSSIGWMAAGFALAALGCFLSQVFTQPLVPILGVALLASIVIYTALHKRTPFAIIPMGICRSLLYLLGYCSVASVPVTNPTATSGNPEGSIPGILQDNALFIVVLMALGILSYVAGLTLAARYESGPANLPLPRIILWVPIFLCALTHTWWWICQHPLFLGDRPLVIPALLCLLPFCIWTVRALSAIRKSIGDFVSRALAGLCLVDLLAFAGIATTIRTGWSALDANPLVLTLIPLSCFLFSLLLQRIAPAT